MLTAIVGTNWGDEGKGRMVDLLSENYDIVVRYQGGNNAGHTVVNDKGKFILNLLPSGILRDDTVNVLGAGIVIDLEHLFNETARLRAGGIAISPANLKISDRATICMPYHKLLDGLEEDRLGDKKFGSTRRGISPVYSDKFMKKALRMGDLKNLDHLRGRIADIIEWKNLTVAGGYGHEPIDVDEIMAWLEKYGKPFADYVCDTTVYLTDAVKAGKSVMFEAQLGALRDIDFGIYPYTSASTTLAAYAPIGSGVPQLKLDESIGIMKAYSSCVGEGPFTCELFGDEAHALREADFIFRDEIAKAHLEGTMNQYFAVLTNMRSVGVMGDGRTYDYTLALRSVTTTDFMTADWARIPYDVLDKVSVRIVNEVKGINRIVYDITSKPPATIEWE